MFKESIKEFTENLYQEVFERGDRELTKQSISGSEFGKPIYRIWRERNPDESYIYKPPVTTRQSWATGIEFRTASAFGTGLHILLEQADDGKFKEHYMELQKEHYMELQIDNNFKLTGTSDKIFISGNKFTILDYKTVGSSVFHKVGELLADGLTDDEYFSGYRHQASLYSYIFKKTQKNLFSNLFWYPNKMYLSYIPRSLYQKHTEHLEYGEYSLLAELPTYPMKYVEKRINKIRDALSSLEEPEFDCDVTKDCKYCKARCQFNKNVETNLERMFE